jgi:hypothetical protein
MGAKNVFGCVNSQMLIQEYLKGKEFVVDCISMDGKHLFVENYLYHKEVTKEGGIV